MNKKLDEAQPSAPEPPQYQEVSEYELEGVLADHLRWLDTESLDIEGE